MKINRSKLSNPCLKAYADIKGIPDGGEIVVTEYMEWIDRKDSEYRRRNGVDRKTPLTKDQERDFIDFLWLK